MEQFDLEQGISYGFLPPDEEQASPFTLKSLDIKGVIKSDLKYLLPSEECLIFVTKQNHIVRKKNSSEDYEKLLIPFKPESEVVSIYIDVHGYHCIIFTSKKEIFYLHLNQNQILPLTALKCHDVTSLYFSTGTTLAETKTILIGTKEGVIFSYGIKLKNNYANIDEIGPTKVHALANPQKIVGLFCETYEFQAKADDIVKNSTLIMVFTLDTCFQFAGDAADLGKIFEKVILVGYVVSYLLFEKRREVHLLN